MVTVEQVALHAGLTLPVGEADLPAVQEAISSAHRRATAFLNRPTMPAQFVQTGVVAGGSGWLLEHDPVIEVVSAVPELDQVGGYPTGRYTVTYRAGLDPDADPAYGAALDEWVIAAAAASPLVRRIAQNTAGARIVAQVNVEGQGVTYESTAPAAGSGSAAAGAPPSLEDLRPWKRWHVSQRPGIGPHPAQTGAAWWL
ncbi:hypothetical protein ACGFJC_47390 [Nonomuraea fuscirosea]|uniref:hypothetical protein n=1 Tax=Nonomuraea fuscirosea TaxID=1291556 RepID=UPI00371A445A